MVLGDRIWCSRQGVGFGRGPLGELDASIQSLSGFQDPAHWYTRVSQGQPEGRHPRNGVWSCPGNPPNHGQKMQGESSSGWTADPCETVVGASTSYQPPPAERSLAAGSCG